MKIDSNCSIGRFVAFKFLPEDLVPDPLSGLSKILERGSHDVRQILLRAAIIKREPSALYLDLDAVALEKGVIGGVQAKAIFEDFVGGYDTLRKIRDRRNAGRSLTVALI